MNTKKSKNKSKHKPNPSQAQTTQTKTDNVELKTENVEINVTEESKNPVQQSLQLKSDKPIPLVSETVDPPPETKVSESDTPKKPKRNRGKKKKTETGNADDIIVEKVKDDNTSTPKEEKTIVNLESTEEPDVVVEEKLIDTQEITPAARKKKKKSKNLPEAADKPKEEVTFTPLNKEELDDVKIVTLIPIQTESEENKSKKKNKKKKRSDSEKSERTEDVLSCTAAFQKLLEGNDKQENKNDNKLDEAKQIPKVEAAATATVEGDKQETKKDNKLDEAKQMPRVKSTVTATVDKQEIKQDNKLDKAKQVPKVETTPTTTVNEPLKMQTTVADTQQIETEKSDQKEESGKRKKKNKKDKKEPAKLENVEDTSKIADEKITSIITEEAEVIITNICKDSENMTTKNVGIQDQTSQQLFSQEITLPEKEKSPKPQAKIAKPVEKKRKDTTGMSSKEDLIEATSDKEKDLTSETEETVSTKLKALVPPVEMIEFASEVQRSIAEEVRKNKLLESATQSTDLKEVKEKEVSEKCTKNKGNKNKHKNSESTKIIGGLKEDINPADIKNDDHKKMTEECKVGTFHSERTEETKEKVNKPVSTLQESITCKPIAIPLGFKTSVQEDEAKTIVPPELDVTHESEVLPQKAESLIAELQVPEMSMGKKRKKSPKRAKGDKQSQSSTDISKQVILTSEETKAREGDKGLENISCILDTSKNAQEEKKKRSESYSELPQLEDIEIRSVKTEESEGSACDITPEIHFPRASSQLLDDNNNMVIRDISTPETKRNIPVVLPDTPFGKSTDSPLLSPELIPLDIPSVTPTSSKVETESTFKTTKDNFRKNDEKTDLKSKVLDVNQGMEELRKSIERSLAELSAMEKNEKEAEEHFAKAQSKLEEIQEIAAKKSEAKAAAQSEAVQKTSQKEFESKVTKEVKEKDETIMSKPQDQIKTSDTKIEGSVQSPANIPTPPPPPPPPPARKDDKGKNKRKDKKGKQAIESTTSSVTSASTSSATKESCSTSTDKKDSQEKKEEKSEQKTEGQEKGKQQSDTMVSDNTTEKLLQKDQCQDTEQLNFEPIENFEDALTSSIDDVNKTFEIIVDEATDQPLNPEINVTAPIEDDEKKDTKQEKDNPVSQPKNLLGHPNIPARLNKTDYKKEKDKIPNNKQAKVKIKDDVPVEVTKESKESQTENKRRFLKDKTVTESIASVVNDNEEYVYKYSFRKVFLPSACHVCKKDLKTSRVPCGFCNLVFYCSTKHKDEDYTQHQALCFAVSTIVHLKDQKHIYADTKSITGQDYRLLRMQMIMSCEKVLKRRLVPWEQEALLYPRLCADPECREWRQNKLMDCEGCGQISYCSDNPDHLPKSHQRWCKSYSLYHRLVVYQQTKGRLEPKLPTRVMAELYQIPEKLNEVLASMFEEKIDMTDIQYAALTQIATAPLTAVYCQQLYDTKMNAIYANGVHKKSTFTIHVVGAELQFEADALNKWEIFFLHLRPDVRDLRVVLIGSDLNPSKLPLDLLGKIKLCANCRQNKRRLLFDFEDNKSYSEYWSSECSIPDLVCAFNPSIQRSSILNGKDTWPATLKCILKLRVPFIITSYTMNEIARDLVRIKQCYEKDFNIISEPKFNPFASVRPDRNFISDDEMPLMFKNFCFAVISGSF